MIDLSQQSHLYSSEGFAAISADSARTCHPALASAPSFCMFRHMKSAPRTSSRDTAGRFALRTRVLLCALFRRSTLAATLSVLAAVFLFPPTASARQASDWTEARDFLKARSNHAMAYDSTRGVIVLFGGRAGSEVFGDTWEWDGVRWSQRASSGPSAREHASMVYDANRRVMVLFGGSAESIVNGETWEWNGASWTRRVVVGPLPRRGHAMAYDSDRRVTVLFGGSLTTLGTTVTDETWEWNGTAWSRRLVTAPAARRWHAMAYDTTRRVTVLFGGRTASQAADDTWEWNGTRWTRRTVAESPSPRHGHAMAYSPVRGACVLMGGVSSGGAEPAVWEWNGQAWLRRADQWPAARAFHTMVYDQHRQAPVLFGGVATSEDPDSETWSWDGSGAGQWNLLDASAPSSRFGHAMAYDTARRIGILFGGGSVALHRSDTWEWMSTGGPRGTGAWRLRHIDGPSARAGHGMVYDSDRGKAVLFGGQYQSFLFHDDTWEYDGSAWTRRDVAGPSARFGHAMAYDSGRRRTVLFGGAIEQVYNAETWEWDGASWTQRLVNGPTPRAGAAMAYDSRRGVTVLFGGFDVNFTDETWEWDGEEWTFRSDTGPLGRDWHTLVYDPARGVTVLFGGYTYLGVPMEDTWEWDGNIWRQINAAGPSGRHSAAGAFDTVTSSVVVFGGVGTSAPSAETWMLQAGCRADFNADGTTDFFDYLAFADAFQQEDLAADFDGNGVVDFFDYLEFVTAFLAPCD